MKKITSGILSVVMMTSLLTGCGNGSSKDAVAGDFNTSKSIAVISREDGSGTRGAFIELFGIEQKGADGSRKDLTTLDSVIAKSTDVLITNINTDAYSIGYVSLGSLNDTIKAIEIDGVSPTPENVKNDSYKISRSFNVVTKGDPSGLTKDFLDYILSSEGQAVIAKSYITVSDDAAAYSGDKPSGKIVIAGSSSVTPIMEKLKEAYILVNPNASIEIQQSDSSSGITGTLEGTCDIGMVSRDLKDSEKGELVPVEIARDGIAIIVNTKNPVTNLTTEEVKSIYTGEVTEWSEVIS